MRRLGVFPYVLAVLVLSAFNPHVGVAAPATATISAVVSDATAVMGSMVYVDLFINTGGQSVGGVAVVADYSSNLTFNGLSIAGSVFETEVVAITTAENRLRFERVRNQLGYSGGAGFIARVAFIATSAGSASVSLVVPGSESVAFVDSTNILNAVTSASFVVEEEVTVSASTPSPSVFVSADDGSVINPGAKVSAAEKVVEVSKEVTGEEPEKVAEAAGLPLEDAAGVSVTANGGLADLDSTSNVLNGQQKAEIYMLPLLLGVLLAMNLLVFYRFKR